MENSLFRYIPENFYTDFNLSDTTSLEATTVTVPSSMTLPAVAASHQTIQPAQPSPAKLQSAPITTILQAATPVIELLDSNEAMDFHRLLFCRSLHCQVCPP